MVLPRCAQQILDLKGVNWLVVVCLCVLAQDWNEHLANLQRYALLCALLDGSSLRAAPNAMAAQRAGAFAFEPSAVLAPALVALNSNLRAGSALGIETLQVPLKKS